MAGETQGVLTTAPGEFPSYISDDQRLSEVTDSEKEAFVSVPTIDITKYQAKPEWYKLMGQGFMDSLIQQAVDTPATTMLLVGRKEMERAGAEGPDNKVVQVAEKMRDFGIALRKKVSLDEAQREQPVDFGGRVASGLGSGAGSMMGLVLSSLAGGAAGAAYGGAAGGPPGAAVGAVAGSVAVGWTSDFLNEKAALAQELMDAGYSARFTDMISTIYATPVATLDFVSFKILGRLLRPPAVQAIRGTIFRRLAGAALSGAEGLVTEGGTETMQQRIQTEFEIGTKLRDRKFQDDLADDIVAMTVGGLIGGTAGVAGQMRARQDAVSRLSDVLGVSHTEVAKLVDSCFLEANDSIYDTLSQHFDISGDMKWINNAFKKLEGKTELSEILPEIEETMSDEFALYQDMLDSQKPLKSYYRGGPESAMPKGKTAADIVEYERTELGNEDVKPVPGVDLTAVPSDNLVWLTETETQAKEYGDAVKIEGENYRVLARDGQGGVLVEKIPLPKTPTEIIASVEKQVDAAQAEVLKAMDAVAEAKTDSARSAEVAGLQEKVLDKIQESMDAEHKLEGVKQLVNKLEGRVALTSGQVRIATRQQLKQILDAYKTGKKFSEQDLKAIQKAFKFLLKGTNLSRKSVMNMLRSVLSIRTPEQFNNKIGVIVGHINTIIRSEIVKDYQKIGQRMIEKMQPAAGKVDPATQLFAEHLARVFQGKVPLTYDINAQSIPELVKAQVEEAVYDLRHAADDVGVATRAVDVLTSYYKNKLQKFQDFKAQKTATYQRISDTLEDLVTKGEKFDELKAAFDSSRSKDKRKNRFLMTPYDTAVMTLLNKLDNASGAPSMEGPLVKEFISEKPYQAMIVLMHQAKERVEGKLYEIYGKDAQTIWVNTRSQDFLNVKFSPELGNREVNISRAEAMSLYLMSKMPGTYNDLIKMGVDESWLAEFEQGNNVSFSEKDYRYMESVRETLNWFADLIAPVFERLKERPFRRIDNYFMTSRFMARSLEEGGIAETDSIIDSMLNGDFEKVDPASMDSLKSRTKSDRLFRIPDIFEAMSFYMSDMVHFIAYADYVVKLQNVFQNQRIKQIMADKLPPAYPAVIKEYIETLAKGSVSRDSDRQSMGGLFKLLGLYARNQVATPKNFIRQLTGISAAMDLEGASGVKLAEAIADLPRAIKSGELKRLTETSYMKERFAGLYEMAVLYVQEQARAGRVKGDVSQSLHNFFTLAPRYGDRFASIAVGWMIYRDRMAKVNDPVVAIQEAIKAIDDTQQSMDVGKTPVAFNRSSLPARLLTVFQRTQAIYLDRYLRALDAVKAGRISKRDFIRTMMVFHVWVPLFEVLVTAGQFEPWETGLAMAAGPFSFHLIVGAMLRSIAAGVMEGVSDDEADLPFYLKDASDSTLIGSFARDVTKLMKSVTELFRYPDYETMWGAWKTLGAVGDISPVPAKWLMRTPEGFYELFQGDPESIVRGAKIIAGWPESRTKEN